MLTALLYWLVPGIFSGAIAYFLIGKTDTSYRWVASVIVAVTTWLFVGYMLLFS